jgi:enoyl-CoA hydratase/carnithine racemase
MKRASRTRLVTDDGLDLEIEAAARVVTGPDAREGLAAFVEKREPRFAAADR